MGIYGEMQKTFHLQNPNFALSPEKDWICYYGREDIERSLSSIIWKSLKASITPKIVVLGDWGWGKTQTLYHFYYTLLMQYATPVFVECPEFSSKTGFLDFFNLLMNKISKEDIVRIVRNVAARKRNFDMVKERDLRHLCQNVLAIASGDTLNIAWNWLTGEYIKDPTKIDVSTNQISVTTATNILETIGEFFLTIEGKPLIFCIDEAHRLKNIPADSDYERPFIQALRKTTMKNYSVGFIYAIGAHDEKDIPHMFVEAEVKDRIGDYFITIPALDETSMKKMILGIIKYVRDGYNFENHKANEPEEEIKNSISILKKKKYDVDLDTYPFTVGAIDQIMIYFDAEDMVNKRTPRDVCDILNDCGTEEEALKIGVIDENVVSKVAAERKLRERPSIEA